MMKLHVGRTSSRAITRRALKQLFTYLRLRAVFEAIIERTVLHLILKRRAITSVVPEHELDDGDEQ